MSGGREGKLRLDLEAQRAGWEDYQAMGQASGLHAPITHCTFGFLVFGFFR